MTCYNCNNCRRREKHISQMAEFPITRTIGKLKVRGSFWICKWCLTKAGIEYSMHKGWITSKKAGVQEK